MNFNNIPKGLLVPLFFGEISVNGGSSDSNSNEIGCKGALNQTDWISISGDWALQINGIDIVESPVDIANIIEHLKNNGFDVLVDDQD